MFDMPFPPDHLPRVPHPDEWDTMGHDAMVAYATLSDDLFNRPHQNSRDAEWLLRLTISLGGIAGVSDLLRLCENQQALIRAALMDVVWLSDEFFPPSVAASLGVNVGRATQLCRVVSSATSPAPHGEPVPIPTASARAFDLLDEFALPLCGAVKVPLRYRWRAHTLLPVAIPVHGFVAAQLELEVSGASEVAATLRRTTAADPTTGEQLAARLRRYHL